MPRAQLVDIVGLPALAWQLHCLRRLPEGDCGDAGGWLRIESAFSRRLPLTERCAPVRVERRERGVWQRRLWGHLIVADDDWQRDLGSIHINAIKHGHVDRSFDWPRSSLHQKIALATCCGIGAGVMTVSIGRLEPAL